MKVLYFKSEREQWIECGKCNSGWWRDIFIRLEILYLTTENANYTVP